MKSIKLIAIISTLLILVISLTVYINRNVVKSKAGSSGLPSTSLGVGECHWPGDLANPAVKWGYPSSEVFWSVLEPRKGEYNFQPIDDLITQARAQRKKIWLQVLVSNPDTPYEHPSIPQWAIDEGMQARNPGVPVQWDPKYLEYHEKILKALAEKYEKPEYYDVIEAILIMAGGNYGEMALDTKYCVGDPNIPPGEKADAEDPNNYWVKKMARVVLGSENRSEEIAKRDENGWVFDTYYIQAVKNIIDIYSRTFRRYPFVLQIGTGISCQARVYREVVGYGINKYGNHLWLKTNSWGSFTGLGTNDPNVIDPFFNQYKTKTIIAYEVGHPSYWCAAEGDVPRAICDGCCHWGTREEALRHNANAINLAINSGATAVCFQPEFFHQPEKYSIDFSALQRRLELNYQELIGNITPFPPQPTVTPTPTPAPQPSATPTPTVTPAPRPTATPTPRPTATPTPTPTSKPGDINGDSKVDEVDYAILMANFGKTVSPGDIKRGDLTGDGKVDEADYAVLIANFGK